MDLLMKQIKNILNQKVHYPIDIHNQLLKACSEIYLNKESIIRVKKETGKALMIFRDDIYDLNWLIDLSGFKHLLGVGPSKTNFDTLNLKYLDISEQFNKQYHNNQHYLFLLRRAVGLYYIADQPEIRPT